MSADLSLYEPDRICDMVISDGGKKKTCGTFSIFHVVFKIRQAYSARQCQSRICQLILDFPQRYLSVSSTPWQTASLVRCNVLPSPLLIAPPPGVLNAFRASSPSASVAAAVPRSNMFLVQIPPHHGEQHGLQTVRENARAQTPPE